MSVPDYHGRSKHALDRYAAGPVSLDWEAQPCAFRDWADTQQIALPRKVVVTEIDWCEIGTPRPALPLNRDNLGSMLRLCVGLTAWKEYAGSHWSLRAHPSSGNLHPTETWLICLGLAGLEDGLYHYHSLHHALERRAWGGEVQSAGLWVGFSSIHWREAWKYGERAFRYCQLDMGHVLTAVCYAASLHGWRVHLAHVDSSAVSHCLGLDRVSDFAGVEGEEPEVIVALESEDVRLPIHWQQWAGKPSLLDPRPLYQWPVIEAVAQATRGTPPCSDREAVFPVSRKCRGGISASQVILKRRSAQHFDGESLMPNAVFRQILTALFPGGSPVWSFWSHVARVHPVMMVHRVEGMAPGLYVMPRAEAAKSSLRSAFRDTFTWQVADHELPIFQLVAAKSGKIARTLSCRQDIASQCAVTFMMVAEFAASIAENPAAYRHLHWEAGMLGHVITLEAEAAGWRGTGIGCFFDDADHEVLGLTDDAFQVIYHYAVGMALDDPRIMTRPAYE